MNKLHFTIRSVAAILAACLCASCVPGSVRPSGRMQLKELKLSGFNAIEATGLEDIVFTQGPYSVVIYADDNLLPYIKCTVRNGVLLTGVKNNLSIKGDDYKIEYRISAPDLRSIIVRGASDVDIVSPLSVKQLNMEIYGNGDIDFKELTADKCSVRIAGTGDIEAAGLRIGEFTSEVAGKGDISIDGIFADVMNLNVTGLGNLSICGIDAGRIDASLIGMGSMELKGKCSAINIEKTGVGKIDTRELEKK